MGYKSFKFKQFEVFHDKTAMKVGTDGVLLGAWVDLIDTVSILDIGTGTGLIALMIAQRNSKAIIQAIEIDSNAALQAIENVEQSPFASRIRIEKIPFKQFAKHSNHRFDVIVSNPPFFIDGMHSPDVSRTNARHNTMLSIYDLLEECGGLLNPNGRLAVIYPAEDMQNLLKAITEEGWQLLRKTDVYTTVGSKKPKRLLLEMCRIGEAEVVSIIKNRLFIEKSRHRYTDGYVNLTRDFYLNM